MKLKKMRTDRLICLNSKINGKQPPIEDRIYWAGGVSTTIVAHQQAYGGWIMYEEESD